MHKTHRPRFHLSQDRDGKCCKQADGQRRFPQNIVLILIGFYSFPDIVAVNDKGSDAPSLNLRTNGRSELQDLASPRAALCAQL
jgi:hypothetical protein